MNELPNLVDQIHFLGTQVAFYMADDPSMPITILVHPGNFILPKLTPQKELENIPLIKDQKAPDKGLVNLVYK